MRAFIDLLDDPHGGSHAGASAVGRLRAQFADPVAILRADELADVAAVLQQVQAHALAGRWCVGALAYEAAGAFDAALSTHEPRPGWPLAQFAVFERALPWPEDPADDGKLSGSSASGPAPEWLFETSQQDYAARVERAREVIAAGECYQVNLTEALQTQFSGDVAAWFTRLRAAQPGGYLAWLDWGEQQVLSLSPELFFDWRPDGLEGWLKCQPMKGTAPRHADAVLDAQARQHLRDSDKERAENVMIVDLLRSDMGRVAQPGSVQVPRLFELQALPTVWQMTSTVTARTRPGVGLADLFGALFPCGSVTGAPKARAMHWIRELEQGPRGIYCGAVGLVRPGGAATFNVPIRTVVLERSPVTSDTPAQPCWTARAGVGSAITFYAEPQAEWRELAAKARFLERCRRGFELLETLRLEDGRYWLLQEHLSRMAASAAYFGFVWRPDAVQACLEELARGREAGTYRVRLTCSPAGQLAVEAFELQPTAQPVIFAISEVPMDSMGREHEFVVHKTTRREHYETRLRPEPGVFDTLLLNECGELTEFTRGNVALHIEGQWLTPALACGLLPGTYRAYLLARGEITEAVLTRDDLQRASQVAFFNGLRGWLVARLLAPEGV